MYIYPDITCTTRRCTVAMSSIRHKHLRIDQAKLDRARKILAVEADTEALDRALALVVSEAEIDAALRSVAGKARDRNLEKVDDSGVAEASAGQSSTRMKELPIVTTAGDAPSTRTTRPMI